MKIYITILLFFCGFIAAPFVNLAYSQTYGEIRIFVDVDKDLVNKAGGLESAETFTHELIAKVDAIYRSQLGLTITLVGTHFWNTENPFVKDSLSSTLSSFASYSEANYRTSYNYDVAHLLLGSDLGGEGGIAYLGTACGTPFTSSQAYSLSQPDLSDLYEFNAHLFAHELGHNLNSEHDIFPSCKSQTIMCPAQIGSNFSIEAKNAIAEYVQNRKNDNCFQDVSHLDPTKNIALSVSISGGNINYKISGAENCTTLSLVASPSVTGLETLFAYLQIGKLTPASTINATSKNVLKLRKAKQNQNKLYIGIYCDGQLNKSKSSLNTLKIKSKKSTNSYLLALRSLQKGFKLKN